MLTIKEYSIQEGIPLRTVYHRIKTGKLETEYEIKTYTTKVLVVKGT